MDQNSGSARAFVSAVLALVGVLLVAYLVFITLKMAPPPGARQTLAVLGLALLGGIVATVAGMAGTRRR